MGHIAAICRVNAASRLAAALVCALTLSGCGGGVELEGKVFDYMGISGSRQEADVRMGERAPLMLPPNLGNLPQPGTGAAVATARQDWPDDPEVVRKRVAKQEQAKQAEIKAAADPTNPYAGKPTLLDRWFKKSDDEVEPVAAVPEPDPSDAEPASKTTASAPSNPTGLTPHVPQAPMPKRDTGESGTPDSYGGMSNPAGNQAAW
ncbi:MAG: hypothetical protein ACREDO_06560 [Methyloceanibacter sp.]